MILILANLIPLFGVVQFDWSVRDILILYWTESVIIGVINIMRMMKSQAGDMLSGILPFAQNIVISAEGQLKLPALLFPALKLFMIGFFIVHYGGFCLGHLMALLVVFAESDTTGTLSHLLQTFWKPEYWIGVAAIAFSHTFSFFNNFVGKTEYRNIGLFALMLRPYGRIVIMHIAIIAGALLILQFGSPLPALVVLVLLKTAMDLRLHNKERKKLALVTGPGDVAAYNIKTGSGPII